MLGSRELSVPVRDRVIYSWSCCCKLAVFMFQLKIMGEHSPASVLSKMSHHLVRSSLITRVHPQLNHITKVRQRGVYGVYLPPTSLPQDVFTVLLNSHIHKTVTDSSNVCFSQLECKLLMWVFFFLCFQSYVPKTYNCRSKIGPRWLLGEWKNKSRDRIYIWNNSAS